jgi:hypothetical protein
MTPKEKAVELVDKYYDMKWQSYSHKKTSIKSMTKLASKHCALLAVDEIIESALPIWDGFHSDARNDFERYWNDIKTEIENL